MLIRTNSILKLDLPFTETPIQDTLNDVNSVNSEASKPTTSIRVDNSDFIQKDMNDNIKARRKKNDSESATVLAPDKQGSFFICRTDQDEDVERGETQAQTTSFPCSPSSESIYGKTTITNCLEIHQYASTNCNDAAYILIEQRTSYQNDDDNNSRQGVEEHLNGDWIIQDAANGDAAHHVDQGSFVSSMNLNQQRHIDDDDDDTTNSTYSYKQQQREEWFKGTLFYVDPGTAPTLPPKDYISINHLFDLEEDKKDIHEPTLSPSLYSLAISTKIRSSISNRRRTITGKVRNALTKRKSFFFRA